ncbi:MAG: CHAP domain-containing protein [Treponema sp.]|jgi:hypothetical protein|nr:CHAP domain-containing protein [Treponema sp.]
MTIEEFVEKNTGKKVDYDGAYGAQCVDLFRQYVKDVLNIPEHTGSCSTSGGAKDLFLDYAKMPLEKKYFIKITNKSFIPGDVAVWDESEKNKYGHVAIVLGKLNNDLIVFEQDGLKQNGARITLRSMERLLGGLRKK